MSEKMFGFISAPPGWERISWRLCDEEIDKKGFFICRCPVIGWSGYIEPYSGYREYVAVYGFDSSYAGIIDSFDDDMDNVLGFLQPGEVFLESEWVELAEDDEKLKKAIKK